LDEGRKFDGGLGWGTLSAREAIDVENMASNSQTMRIGLRSFPVMPHNPYLFYLSSTPNHQKL
jgi:hypothetical protein